MIDEDNPLKDQIGIGGMSSHPNRKKILEAKYLSNLIQKYIEIGEKIQWHLENSSENLLHEYDDEWEEDEEE